MLSILGRLLFWLASLTALLSFGLAIYVVYDPSLAAPYDKGVGVFALILFGCCTWAAGRAAMYILED